jgi:hypothetical protein
VIDRRCLTLAVAVLACILAGCRVHRDLLPGSVYYQMGTGPNAQVWRLEPDGRTTTRLTDEPDGVDGFSVSRADGSLAIVSGNRLILVTGDGENRRQIADGNLVDRNDEDDVFRCTVSSPVFAPDGRTLAYALDGLHLYDLSTGQDRHVLKNLGNLNGESFVFAREVYAPGPWSPLSG